jgi:hypothetical protein
MRYVVKQTRKRRLLAQSSSRAGKPRIAAAHDRTFGLAATVHAMGFRDELE